MEDVLNVSTMMDILQRNNITPEALVDRAIRNLYLLESVFSTQHKNEDRNRVRAVIAHVKLLYDFGQRMYLARTYLLHKIKLLEVRENDLNAEISVLRGASSSSGEGNLLGGERSFISDNRNHLRREDEIEIIHDTRMIGEIDQSQEILQEINKKIMDKKKTLLDIENRMDAVSSSLITSKEIESSFKMERTNIHSSKGAERPQDVAPSSRSRNGGIRILPPRYTIMASQMENEKTLLSQGGLGTSRDRHSGEPDAAGSIVDRRESSEGTAGVASACAPTAQVATAESIQLNEEEILHGISEKRKASTSPGIEDSEAEDSGARRPHKARIIESTESDNLIQQDYVCFEKDDSDVGYDEESIDTAKLFSSSPENRVPRRSTRKNKFAADFKELTDVRQKKINKSWEAGSSAIRSRTRSTSFERLDKVERVNRIIQPIVDSIRKQNEEEAYKDRSSDVSYSMERSSDDVTDRNYQSKKKKNKKKVDKKGESDITMTRRMTQKARKRVIPTIVTKEEAEKEMGLTREDWLRMNAAELGARCLDHLSEWDRQRSLCSNISGQVSGRMKDCKQITIEIVKALVEKITTVGDVYTLRNENFMLKEELAEIKRKEQTQTQEIMSLRKMISSLEREVRSLKEGLGPFPPIETVHYPKKMEKQRQITPDRRYRDMKSKEKSPAQMESPQHMEVEPLMSHTPGYTADEHLMDRKYDWPIDEDATPWTNAASVEKNRINDHKTITKNEFKNKTYENKNTNKEYVKSNVGNQNVGSGNTQSLNKGIRIRENIQLVPPAYPSPNPTPSLAWKKVGKKGKIMPDTPNRTYKPTPSVSSAPNKNNNKNNNKRAIAGKKLVKPAVVTIKCKPGKATYSEILAKARQKVSLKELGIQDTVIRRALNGAMVIELPGPQGRQLASSLSCNLMEVLGDEAEVSNPVSMGELRIRGIDPSTTEEEVRMVLENIAGCKRNELKVSNINNMRDGMGVVWVSCPQEIAVKIAQAGVINLGWTRVKIDLLKKRPVQCYRCWHFGHLRNNCKSEKDRTGFCFRCGINGHNARECTSGTPKCAICDDIGYESKHRIGSSGCLANQGFPREVQLIKRPESNIRSGKQLGR